MRAQISPYKLTFEEHSSLVFEQGCKYAEQLPGITEEGLEMMLRSSSFWTWWRRRWRISDDLIIKTRLMLTLEEYVSYHLDNLQPGLPVTLYIKAKEVSHV